MSAVAHVSEISAGLVLASAVTKDLRIIHNAGETHREVLYLLAVFEGEILELRTVGLSTSFTSAL